MDLEAQESLRPLKAPEQGNWEGQGYKCKKNGQLHTVLDREVTPYEEMGQLINYIFPHLLT